MILPIHGGEGGGGGGGHRLVGTWPCDYDTYIQHDCSHYGYTLYSVLVTIVYNSMTSQRMASPGLCFGGVREERVRRGDGLASM